MRRCSILIVPVILFFSPAVEARQFGCTTSVLLRGNYVSTAKIFLNPDATLESLRSEYLTIYDLLGGGLELRVSLPGERIFFTASVDYLSKASDGSFLISINGALNRTLGSEVLKFIPFEFGMNTYVPLGSEDFRLSMGGGLGAYYAVQTLTILGAKTTVTNDPIGYGIHINTGFEYRVNSNIIVRTELKFRDPEIVNVNRYGEQLPESRFRTRIQLDGLSASAGVMVELF